MRIRARAGRTATTIVAGALLFALQPSTPAAALVDGTGASIANTATTSPDAQLAGPRSLAQKLAEPFSPADDNPATLATLGSTGNPEDDLGSALDELAAAPDAAAADGARTRALAILEGDPIPGKAYSGMPLLNWNAPAKVKVVPAGGNVVVSEVRFGQHTLTDTAVLDFQDPNLPFTITYRVAELGPGAGGWLTPTPLLDDGPLPIGGLHSVIAPLGLGLLPTGTQTASRFHPGGAAETTRQGVQEMTVRMPPPGHVHAILDPSLRPGDGALATLRPATAARLTELRDAFGFSGAAPSALERTVAIGKIGDAAPEKQVWNDLRALPPASDAAFLAAAHAVGAADRQLVASMRTREQLPPGVAADPSADVAVAFLNDEVYVSKSQMRLAPGAALTVSVTNADRFAHHLEALDLHGRRPVFGAIDWGQFDWRSLDAGAAGVLPPGQTTTITLTPRADSFTLALGDPDHGDQAGAVVSLDRGPKRESLAFEPAFAAPLHSAEDKEGNLWLTLAGVDSVARITPAANLGDSQREEYLIPGGTPAGDPGGARQGPQDVAVDPNGIVWVTLLLGNAIARIDPALAKPGTSDGVTVYKLEPCTDTICAPRFPPEPTPAPLTRSPLQMDVTQDGYGNTVVWFTEEAARRVGVLRVAPDGAKLNQVDYGCACAIPLGIALGPDGSVWFTAPRENFVGRLTPDQARPWAASTVHLGKYAIPSSVSFQDPALGPGAVMTANPHSIAVDRRGLVWFTEEALPKLGVLDPARARQDSTAGITELDLGNNDFGREARPADIAIDRAGDAFWVDEYGDMVGAISLDGQHRSWRPAERQSLTDSPLVDAQGNFWFGEGGANLLTRISGVTAGAPRPAAMPVVTAATSDGTLTASGLREMDSVDVDVVRAARTVSSARGVPLDARGGFALGGADRAWDLAGAPVLAGGDTVTITPHGRFAAAPFSFQVATLDPAVDATGAVVGHATAGGRPLADHVVVEAGGVATDAPIADSDGGFGIRTATMVAGGVVTWSGASPSAVFRTRTAFGAPAPAGAGPGSVEAGGPAPGAPPVEGPGRHSAPASPGAAAPRRQAGCPRVWLSHSAGRPWLPLLGITPAAVRKCLGAPSRAGRSRLEYGPGLRIEVRRGLVQSIDLRDPSLRSDAGDVGIGSTLAALRKVLGPVTGDPARHGYRAVMVQGRGRAADVRVAVVRGRVTRISAVLLRLSDLDGGGRALVERRR